MSPLYSSGGYQLTIIEDEQVALAGGIPTTGNNFFFIGMLMVFAVALIIGVVSYYIRVRYYRNCLNTLSMEAMGGVSDSHDWSIRNMKTQIAALELDIVGADVEKFIN